MFNSFGNQRNFMKQMSSEEEDYNNNMQQLIEKQARYRIKQSQKLEEEKKAEAKERVRNQDNAKNSQSSEKKQNNSEKQNNSTEKKPPQSKGIMDKLSSTAKDKAKGSAKVAIVSAAKKILLKYAIIIGLIAFVILFIVVAITTIFKNADSQIYSNENDGKTDSEQYPDNDSINPNIFVKYPGIYEKIEQAASKVANEYSIDIDKYLILATLIAPIENGNIIPVSDDSCGETDCYYFEGKSYTWTEFLELWGDQAEYLAKAQIMTYVNESSTIKVKCKHGSETPEQIAKNDMDINEFNFWKLFNPVNWFKGFRDAAGAEVNAKCIKNLPAGKSKIPTVYVLSAEQGIYYNSINANNEKTFVKEPETGGVYFWNLVNEGGFIHVYMKDYLNVDPSASNSQNYQQNLPTILDIGNYIYEYYESIRKDCDGRLLIESTIEEINVAAGTREGGVIDFEDQYIGGVMLAEYHTGSPEALKAFAILARSFAVSVVGVNGDGTIENSSNDQNYNPSYSPEKYPEIAAAVEATRGLVVTKFGTKSVMTTMYDGFCPVKTVLENGFYYLPDGQNNLPINPDAYQRKTGGPFIVLDKYLKCPCFQSFNDRPHDQIIGGKPVKFHPSSSSPPTYPLGYPPQSTKNECWTFTGNSRENPETYETEYGWAYKPLGGHGQGASQLGLKYFGAWEYDYEAIIKLFYGDEISIKRLSSSLEEGECDNASMYEGGEEATIDACGVSFDVSTESNHTKRISGNPLNTPLTDALHSSGYNTDCLNQCISQRVLAAGLGTRYGVAEAAIALLECTMEMTGGFTYPYDHNGGKPSMNPDINGKAGVNSRWGEYESWATGCSSSKCRLGLNCANFVRWSMCNGGINELCTKGSSFATGMAGVNSSDPDYFPGAIRIHINGNSFYTTPNITIGELPASYKEKFGSVYDTNTKVNNIAIDKILSLIQPGDVLYSDVNGGDNHVMVIVGVEDSAIWIAENGRKTRLITYDELKNGKHNYAVLLLDGFY